MRTWRRSGQWALVVLPAGEIPVTADPATYLGTAHVFEETGMAEQAAIAYRAATERWPEDVRGWMMSGNMAFAEKNFDEAVTDFLTASGIAPDNPTTWNNLAYALREKGCIREAKTALQCALLISPEDRNLRDSLKEINRVVIAGRKPGYCEPVNCAQSSLYLGQRPSRE